MSSKFTPSNPIDLAKERDWAAGLGMLDWDDTSIVFSKRTLIEFLKYTGTTVDTNFNNISKLPRYAKFGKLSELTAGDAASPVQASSGVDDNRPSRRVRDVPGGQHTDIFAPGDEDDALSTAPPKEGGTQSTEAVEYNRSESNTALDADQEHEGIDFGSSSFRPSRRVRENPGGKSSLSNFWDSPDQKEEFKPTRRVRERPGGDDHINNIF